MEVVFRKSGPTGNIDSSLVENTSLECKCTLYVLIILCVLVVLMARSLASISNMERALTNRCGTSSTDIFMLKLLFVEPTRNNVGTILVD